MCAAVTNNRRRLERTPTRELVTSLFVLPVFGGDARKPSPDEARVNLARYGVATPFEVIQKWRPAGVILFGRNTQDPEFGDIQSGNIRSSSQIRTFLGTLRTVDPLLLVGVDQEGGRVDRLRSILGRQPPARSLAANPTALERQTRRTATSLRALGINAAFAPVADVVQPTTGSGGIIGDRSFGSDPSVVANDVLSVVTGLQNNRVAAVVKHWPGHGSSTVDSHDRVPVLPRTSEELETIDLVPFDRAIEGGVSAVMVGHLAVRAWDPTAMPATVSAPMLRRLRSNFCGVIITDSLWMGAVRNLGNDAETALNAITAGVDLLLMPVDVEAAVRRITSAADADPATRARVLDAAARVLALREQYRV